MWYLRVNPSPLQTVLASLLATAQDFGMASSRMCFIGWEVVPLLQSYFFIGPGVGQDGVAGEFSVVDELLHLKISGVEEPHVCGVHAGRGHS